MLRCIDVGLVLFTVTPEDVSKSVVQNKGALRTTTSILACMMLVRPWPLISQVSSKCSFSSWVIIFADPSLDSSVLAGCVFRYVGFAVIWVRLATQRPPAMCLTCMLGNLDSGAAVPEPPPLGTTAVAMLEDRITTMTVVALLRSER